MKNQKTKERFLELRANGMSYNAISNELDCSKQTLIDWSKELWMELHNLREANKEALLEKYRLSQMARIQLFGEQLQAITEELAGRDLSTVSTERLYELALKYGNALGETTNPKFYREEDFTFDPMGKELASWEG